MNLPIVIIAFGTTTKAKSTYRYLNEKIESLLPGMEFFWSYSSKKITQTLRNEDESIHNPAEVLSILYQKGYREVIVQSLHLFPGTEFHNLQQITSRSTVHCRTGRPLLTSPADYQEIADLLAPAINSRPDRIILILGHGTTHPSWTGYYCLEKILRNNFGERIHVGVVEQFPDSTSLIKEIEASDYRKVTIIPFFLIAGMHYRRDIIAENEQSWLSQLKSINMDVEVIDSGLGMLPGIEKIIVRHINEAESITLLK